jgi:hypothetical protein
VAGGEALDLERLAVSLAGRAESRQAPGPGRPRIQARQARTGPAGGGIQNLSGRISLKILTQLTPKYYCRVIQTHSRFLGHRGRAGRESEEGSGRPRGISSMDGQR